MGITAEPLHQGTAGTLMQAAQGAHRRRRGRRAAARPPQPGGRGALRGRAAGRVGLHPVRRLRGRPGSAKDPRYTVVPQRERLARRQAEQDAAAGVTGGTVEAT